MYQIGFTRALLEYISRDEIVYVSGASGGIFTAYALSANKLDYVESLYRRIDITKKVELFWEVFAKELLKSNLDTLLGSHDVLDIPVCFPVAYIPILSTRYYWIRGEYNRVWRKHLAAATNYPFLHIIPSFLHGRIAIDGGAVDNIPLYPLLREGKPFPDDGPADIIFVLHFDAQYEYRKSFSTDIPIVDLDLSYCNGFSKAHYDFSGKTIAERLDKSYEYGKNIAERLFGGDCSPEELRRKADEIFLEEHTARQQSFSIDRLATFLNVISKTIRNDTHCIKKLF